MTVRSVEKPAAVGIRTKRSEIRDGATPQNGFYAVEGVITEAVSRLWSVRKRYYDHCKIGTVQAGG